MNTPYDLYDNSVFTDLSTASFLLYGDGAASSQCGDFYVNDPDDLDRIMTEVQELPGMDWESCTITRYDNDYQNAKESLEGLRNIVFIAIAVVSVICLLVLALFLTLRLRGRVHETGVYLAKECIVKERGHPENNRQSGRRRHRGAGKDAPR